MDATRYTLWLRKYEPGVNPSEGNMLPSGGANRNGLPSEPMSESFIGLNDNSPENAMAVTISGDARKFIVLLFPSLRLLKFLQTQMRKQERHRNHQAVPVTY